MQKAEKAALSAGGGKGVSTVKKRKSEFDQLWEMVEEFSEEEGKGGYEEFLAKILLLIYRRTLVLIVLQSFLTGLVLCILNRL